jgi:hypothetical protein
MSRGDQCDDILCGNAYLRTACDYVHLNPVRARLLEPGARLLGYLWSSEDSGGRAKSEPLKLALAARLRRETTLSIRQIADRLNLGKPKGAKSNLHRRMNRQAHACPQPRLNLG